MEMYNRLFKNIEIKEPPRGLERQILSQIESKERRSAKRRVLAFGVGAVASSAFLVWTALYLVELAKTSGFGQYLSLLFSGDSAVYMYWKELTFSIAETLPVVGLIMFFAAAGAMIWTLAKTITNFQKRKIYLVN